MKSILGNTTRRPDITFYRSGRIDITAHVARILGLREGDVIDIFMDPDSGEHMLYVCQHAADAPGRFEAQCRLTNKHKRGHNFRCHSKRLCDAILNASNCDNIARLPIGTALDLPIYGHAVMLITRNPLAR